MNNHVIEIIKSRNIHPTAYKKVKKAYVIFDKDNNYVLKLNTNNYDIYRYLISREFLFFPENYNNQYDNYDLSLYIKGIDINQDEKINDYIKIISLLHKKTLYKREIDLDEIKEKYENLSNIIISLRKYYLRLNDKIDHDIFLSPSEYLLVRNISLVYSILDNSEILLNETYQKLKNEKSIRISLLHNNIDLDHLIINKEEYLISWDNSYFDSPIYEIEKIYRKYYQLVNLNDLISIYESNNRLTILEKELLIINLAIPKKLVITNNTYLDTRIINNEINYLRSVYEILIKYNTSSKE